MTDHEINDLIPARDRVQANLTRIQTFVQQYDETQDVLNIKLGMGRLAVLVGPCHHGMARPQVADRGTATDKEGSCEYIE